MEKEFKQLQLFYAAALADAVSHYDKAGILSLVTEEKLNKQKLTAPAQLKQLGISTPQELFQHMSNVFGCIQWNVEEKDDAVIAKGDRCLLCSIAKNMQTAQPCFLYCINPIKTMLAALDPALKLKVEKTLWNKDECIFRVE